MPVEGALLGESVGERRFAGLIRRGPAAAIVEGPPPVGMLSHKWTSPRGQANGHLPTGPDRRAATQSPTQTIVAATIHTASCQTNDRCVRRMHLLSNPDYCRELARHPLVVRDNLSVSPVNWPQALLSGDCGDSASTRSPHHQDELAHGP